MQNAHGRKRRCILALLLGVAGAACTTTRQVTPWFRVEHHEAVMDQPVLIGEETHDVALVRRDGRWVRVAKGRVFATRAPDGSAVLFLGENGWQLARETGELATLETRCTFPAFHPSRPALYCAECGNAAVAGAPCLGAIVTELDFAGRVTGSMQSVEPSTPSGYGVAPLAVLPDDAIVLVTVGSCRLFAVAPGGTTLLADRPGQTGCEWSQRWSDVFGPLKAVPLVTSHGNTW